MFFSLVLFSKPKTSSELLLGEIVRLVDPVSWKPPLSLVLLLLLSPSLVNSYEV